MYENVPYLTTLYDKKHEKVILCLVQLLTKNYISYYELNLLNSEDYAPFFTLSDSWWRKCPLIPISLYYKEPFKKFKYALRHMESGDFDIIGGFTCVNLKFLSEKRIKRKIIHLE